MISMMTNSTTMKGIGMSKRIAAVVLLTLVMTMMMTGVATAAYTDAGFLSTWFNAGGGSGTGSPHSNYATTSQKCGYCHAVHNAERYSASADSHVLLRGTVADACDACHVTGSITTLKVYNATAANYNTDNRFNHAYYDGPDADTLPDMGVQCVDCHSVHSAGCVTADLDGTADGVDYILKANAWGAVQTVGTNGDLASGTAPSEVLSTYCTGCHAYYETGYDDDGTAQHHIMGPATNAYGNTMTSYGAGGDMTVAGAPSTDCFTCHDYNLITNGFPHYVGNGTAGERFMNVGAYVGDPAEAAAGANGSMSDGACLKCHAYGTAGDAGIGIDF